MHNSIDPDAAGAGHELIVRTAAAQAVVDRFLAKPMQFGERDCIHMAALNLRKMGYPNPLKASRPYRGAVGAVRSLAVALERLKAPAGGNLADLLDAMTFDRIAPAEALPADFIGYPGEDPFPVALGIAVGNGRAIAYAPDGFAYVGEILPAFTAWRVCPWLR